MLRVLTLELGCTFEARCYEQRSNGASNESGTEWYGESEADLEREPRGKEHSTGECDPCDEIATRRSGECRQSDPNCRAERGGQCNGAELGVGVPTGGAGARNDGFRRASAS